MRLLNKNSKRFIVNLFSDFILSKIDKSEKTIIQVSDCDNFVVVKGKSTSKEILDLLVIKEEFFNEFKDQLYDCGVDHMNIIDVISYGVDVDKIEDVWFDINKNLYQEVKEPITNMFITSEFPYGHSLDCGRSMFYYSNYIFNHMYNLLGVSELRFFYSNTVDSEDDLIIKIESSSKIDNEKIRSLILDVFDFDLNQFNEKLKNYNLIDDVLKQNKEKPYMVQDMLEHVILI
jgi:hypothetical protein